MKNIISCFFLIALSCQSDVDEPDIVDYPNYEICAADSAKYLSYAPTSKVVVNAAGKNIEIDFNCNEYIVERICEYADRLHDTVHTLGQLANVYKTQRMYFNLGPSSGPKLSPYIDGDYVFPKLEYLLAQECIQDNCCNDTRKAILRMVIDKQKIKYELHEQYFMTYSAIQTGEFLIAVILVKESDMTFINALGRDVDLQSVLSLETNSINILDDEFVNRIMQFAENFLKRK
jgi:hypothetical protein